MYIQSCYLLEYLGTVHNFTGFDLMECVGTIVGQSNSRFLISFELFQGVPFSSIIVYVLDYLKSNFSNDIAELYTVPGTVLGVLSI